VYAWRVEQPSQSRATPAGEITLATPISRVRGVGPRRAAALLELGVKNVGQLLAYLPVRHERQEAEAPIRDLVPGTLATARGEVSATRVVNRRPRPRFEAVLIDDDGRLDLVWFNMLFLRDTIHPGVRLRVQGKVQALGPSLRMSNPRVEVLGTGEGDTPPDAPSTEAPGVAARSSSRRDPAPAQAKLRPIYSASAAISSRQIEQAINAILEPALKGLVDHLPEAFRRERSLPELASAYRAMHAPRDEDDARAARRRLAYDELLMLQLGVQMKRAARRHEAPAPVLRTTAKIDQAIRARLPFTLTPAQDRVVEEIARDLARAEPANRLIQGDVGSGKTAVALYAMLLSVAARHQAALLAPTELLAEQHVASIRAMLRGAKVRVELLTGSLTASERRATLARVASGEVDIVVGTHAILSGGVAFKSLGVAVVDEQHRFGVHQRAALRAKGSAPHVLVMTATPIPRTLSLTLFGDLDVSTITGLPPGRTKISTRVVGPESRPTVYEFVRARLDEGERAYIVAPAIDNDGHVDDDDDLIDANAKRRTSRLDPRAAPVNPGAPMRSVVALERELRDGPLRGLPIAVLHGRMSAVERDRVMSAFRAGELRALIATTIIEVGVDVPEATLMVVEDAERFGLAQLHQLRGRVGRGARASACILVAGTPGLVGPDGSVAPPGTVLGDERAQAGARLTAMRTLSDGFKLAERDFELRGFGEIFGTRQSGMPPFRVVDLRTDLDLLALARRDAASWIERFPTLESADLALLRRRVLKAHGPWLGLGDVA
jgi:ATP-dependent DNA helicase RecG